MSDKDKKLYEKIVDQLMLKIRSGELQPGDRLPAERLLAKEHEVSRSVVREAFRAMEHMGCVESRVGGGTYVKTPEISDVVDPFTMLFLNDESFSEELMETRMLLESEIARLAAKRRTEAQLEEMQGTLREMHKEIVNGGTGERQDIQFHAQMVKAAQNRALELVVSTCSEVINKSVNVTQNVEGVPRQALFQHEKILHAIEQKDSEKAVYYMQEHLASAQKNYRKSRSFGNKNTQK